MANAGTIKLSASKPACPGWLGPEARAEWKRVAKLLGAAGLLSDLDQAVLAAYCQATVEHRLATGTLEREGRVITDDAHGGRLQAHPANQLQRSAWAAIEKFAKILGLDPASRGRMAAIAGPVKTTAPVERRKRK